MPPAIIAAGVGAAGTLGGGIIASRQAGRAADTQQRAASEALQFEREREQRRQYEYDQQQRQQREAHEAEQRRLEPYRRAAASVLARYGIQVPIEQEPPPDVAASGAPPAGGLGPVPEMEMPEEDPTAFHPMSLGQLGQWHHWSNYVPR